MATEPWLPGITLAEVGLLVLSVVTFLPASIGCTPGLLLAWSLGMADTSIGHPGVFVSVLAVVLTFAPWGLWFAMSIASHVLLGRRRAVAAYIMAASPALCATAAYPYLFR